MKNTQQAGQQAGIGIALGLTTAMCWVALPIAMKHVLTTIEPFTTVCYRFLLAGVGLLLFLAPRGQLPPLRLFFRWRWLILLAVAIVELLGNFFFFSTSLQYLNLTASQVIGQL